MSDLSGMFSRKALIPFITVGDPNIEVTEEIIRAMVGAGADAIDLGLPFADPCAEGPVIQEADNRALAAGTNTDILFDMVERITADLDVPFIITTYLNPVNAYGVDRFMEKCEKTGVRAIIVPDMPYEEKGDIIEEARAHGVHIISTIAPASEARIHMISSEAEGFAFVMTSPGTTCKGHSNDLFELMSMVRAVATLPCVIDLGCVCESEIPSKVSSADGVIIGTAVVELIAQHGVSSAPFVADYIARLRSVIDA